MQMLINYDLILEKLKFLIFIILVLMIVTVFPSVEKAQSSDTNRNHIVKRNKSSKPEGDNKNAMENPWEEIQKILMKEKTKKGKEIQKLNDPWGKINKMFFKNNTDFFKEDILEKIPKVGPLNTSYL